MTDVRADEIALNRALWAVVNERFTDAAADEMWARPDPVWGLFAVPERDLDVLGDVRGLDVAELACGTAYFSAWLTRAGARTVAVDLSGEQLATARRLQQAVGPLPAPAGRRASGCPWRATASTWWSASTAPPPGATPALASRGGPAAPPGGRLVFLTNSHLSALCVPAEEGVAEERLLRGQREAYRVRWPGGGVEFHPSHGDWVRLLRRSGFVVEALHEIYAPPDRGRSPLLRDRLQRVGHPVARGGVWVASRP